MIGSNYEKVLIAEWRFIKFLGINGFNPKLNDLVLPIGLGVVVPFIYFMITGKVSLIICTVGMSIGIVMTFINTTLKLKLKRGILILTTEYVFFILKKHHLKSYFPKNTIKLEVRNEKNKKIQFYKR